MGSGQVQFDVRGSKVPARLGAALLSLAALTVLPWLLASPAQAENQERISGRMRVHPSRTAPSVTAEEVREAAGASDIPSGKWHGRFKTEEGEEAEVHWHEGTGVPRQIKGRKLHRQVSEGESEGARDQLTARAFFRKHHDLLGLRDPDHELKLTRRGTDQGGRRHLRFSQLHQGIPVWPSDVIVELDRYGDADLVSGAYEPIPSDVITTPVVTPQRAIELARSGVPGGQTGRVSPPGLVIYSPLNRLPRLAWKLEVTVLPVARWLVLIDALTETTLEAHNQIKHGTSIVGSGTDLKGIPNRPLHVWSSGGPSYMVDASKPMFVSASDPPTKATTQGGLVVLDAGTTPNIPNPTLALSQIFSSCNTPFGCMTPPLGIPDAVSASYGLSQTYDYFLQRHGWNSIDDNGATVTAVVRFGTALDNAFWDGQAASMYFGTVFDYAAALDFVGHEWTHGITEATANLFYTGQSAALTEAFADIFGEMVEARTKGTAPDWLKTVTHYAPPQTSKTIQNYANPGGVTCPTQQACPSKLTEYATTVPQGTPDAERESLLAHTNSSIIVQAFYQLSQGMAGAIGLQDAERIFFCALTTKLGAQAQFVDARLGAVACAEQLFGINSPQAQRVAEAFDAVEIFDAPPADAFPSIAAVNGPDSTLFWDQDGATSFLGRVEAALGDPITGTQIYTGAFGGSLSVTGDGSKAIFLQSDDICLHNTNVGSAQPCTVVNVGGTDVFTAAISRDGTKLAFVPKSGGQGAKQIRVAALTTPTVHQSFNVQAPVIEGTSSISVQSLGTVAFTAAGDEVIFEAFNTITFESGSTQGLWSIYSLDLGSGQVVALLPPTPGKDQRFPAVSRTSDRFVTFQTAVPNSNSASIVVLDRSTGNPATVLSGIQESGSARVRPGYTGDDAAIVYGTRTFGSGATKCLRQPLVGQVTPAGPSELWLDDAFSCVVYRRGPYSGPPVATLTVAKTGNGGGTVTSSPPGIICGTDCGESYPFETTVVLIATPNATSHFAGWSGPLDCADGVVIISMAITCTATFSTPALPATATLTVIKINSGSFGPTASLRIISDPPGIDCATVCTATFKWGTTVTLSVEPAPVLAADVQLPNFTGWGGVGPACPGTGSCTLTAGASSASQTVTANFSLGNTRELTVSITGNGSVTSYPPGLICAAPAPAAPAVNLCQMKFSGTIGTNAVYLRPVAAPGYTFNGWTGCSGMSNCAIVMNAANSVTANFVEAPGLPGDDRFKPLVIPNEHFIDRRQITGYTVQAGDPFHGCGSNTVANVWYQFTPREAGRAIISTVPSNMDTIVSAYLATTNLSEVGCNDNDASPPLPPPPPPLPPPPNFPSDSRLATPTLVAGATYLIKVSSRPLQPSESGALTVTFDLLPGDKAAEPIVITKTPFRDTRSVALYDPNPFEPGPPEAGGSCSPGGGNSIFYRFTPTATGSAILTTKGSGYDTLVSVIEETSGEEVTSGCNDDASAVPPIDATSKVAVELRKNVAYLIRVASFGAPLDPIALRSSATLTFALSFTPNPATQFPLTVKKAGTGTGTVRVEGATFCGTACLQASQQYETGTELDLTTTNGTGTFTGWRGGGCSGTGTCTVTMDVARTVTATFVPAPPADFTLFVLATGPPGGPIGISWPGQSNINCNAPCNQSVPRGKVVTLVASLPPPAGNIEFVAFAGWTGCDEVHGLECTVTMADNLGVSAAFIRPSYLVVERRPGEPGRVTSSPAGIDCISGLCGAVFPLISQVALTAAPTKSSSAVQRIGCDSFASPTECTVNIIGKRLVTVGFQPAEVIVTIQRPPGTEGIPALTSNPPGLPGFNCGTNGPVCTSQFTGGQTVVFTPNDVVFRDHGMSCVPGSGVCTRTLELVGQGAPRAITLGTPGFQEVPGGSMPMLPHTLVISLPGTGQGSVLSEELLGIDCREPSCTYAFNDGTMFSLVARASLGSTFVGWDGCDSVNAEDSSICNVTMNGGGRTIRALFTSPRTLTVFKSAAGSGTVSSSPSGITTCTPLTEGSQTPCEAAFEGDSTVRLTPQADGNSDFMGWSGCDVVEGSLCDVVMSTNRTATANFALPTLTINDVTVLEGNSGSSNATFTVSLSKAVGQQVTVKYATADGTPPNEATAGSDYTALALTTLTFTAGQVEKQINVSVQGGTSNEPDETFFVNLSAPTNATLGTKSQGVGTILNDDGPGTLQFSAATYTVGEGGGTATITVRRTNGNKGAVGVTFTTSNGSATAGSDYTAVNQVVNFADGDRADKTVSIPILEDGEYEGDQTLLLTLSNPTGSPAPTLGLSNATLTITDNELPVVTIQAMAPTTITETPPPGQFTVSRGVAASTPLTMSFAVSGTATAGTDYGSLGQSVTIPGGQASAPIMVFPIDDSEVEGDETVTVTLTTDGSYTIGTPGNASITIQSSDVLLTVNKSGTGTGTINSNFPEAIANCTPPCTAGFNPGTMVSLFATQSTGSTFNGWSGSGCSGTGPCNVTMNTAKTVTAAFTLQTFALNVTKTGNGTVTCNGAGVASDCSGAIGSGTLVALTATPQAGAKFVDWGGACNSTPATSLTCTVTMDTAKTVKATFRALPVKPPRPSRTIPPAH